MPGTGALKDLLKTPDLSFVRSGALDDDGKIHITELHGTDVTAGSDGSGGAHGRDPRLRRAGWSWVILRGDGGVIGSTSGGLAGDEAQTVPRAELYAATHFLANVTVAAGVEVELHVDNKYVVDTMQALAAGWRPNTSTLHGDLWALAARHAEQLTSGRIKIVKIKSHLSAAEAKDRGYKHLGWKANDVADKLADEAADRCGHSPGDLSLVESLDEAASLVARRLLAVGRYVLSRHIPPERVARAKVVPLRTRVAEAGRANGHNVHFQHGVGCRSCRQHSRMRQSWPWIGTSCKGPGSSNGHTTRSQHGLTMCLRCGSWAAGATTSKSGLRKPCPGNASEHRARNLARFAKAPPLPPYGQTTWPDGTPVVETTRAKKRQRETSSSGAVVVSSPAQPRPPRGNLTVAASASCEDAHPITYIPHIGGHAAAPRLQALRDRVRARAASESAASAAPRPV